MGYICHNAIIVTGSGGSIEAAYEHAARLLAEHQEQVDGVSPSVLSPLSREVTNGFRSFAIFPDGSKEGWGTSESGDNLRDALVAAIDGMWVEWCEVRFGDEADMNGMTRCSGEPPQLLPTRREVEEAERAQNGSNARSRVSSQDTETR